MADASGTPTSPDSIPTYNTAVDPPSGKGFNTAMTQIQSILTNLKAGTLASGKIAMAALSATGTPSRSNFLRGDGAWTTSPTIIASSLLGGPPASPSVGDIWIATSVQATGIQWAFRYDNAADATYPWQFIGGGTFYSGPVTATYTNTIAGVYQIPGGNSTSMTRTGIYTVDFGGRANNATGGAPETSITVTVNGAAQGNAPDDVMGAALSHHFHGRSQITVATVGWIMDLGFFTSSIAVGSVGWANKYMSFVPVRIA